MPCLSALPARPCVWRRKPRARARAAIETPREEDEEFVSTQSRLQDDDAEGDRIEEAGNEGRAHARRERACVCVRAS